MRVRAARLCLGALTAAVVLAVLYWSWGSLRASRAVESVAAAPTTGAVAASERDETVALCVVCCGEERVPETLTMLKSALVMTRVRVRAIVLCEAVLRPAFEEKLGEWRAVFDDGRFAYDVRPLRFPSERAAEWRGLFKPCAAQRLFLPRVLTDVDAVLYVDTDVLFVDAPERTWREFGRMNATQLAALAPEHHDPNIGWYNRFARHPFYPPLGLNSGVMLMNLTRMRRFGWTEYVGPVYAKYRLRITWGDQDIINIIFAAEPARLLVYGCEHNLRPDHCMYGTGAAGGASASSTAWCPGAERDGAAVVHGSRGFFHRADRQPAFAALYDAFRQYQLGGVGGGAPSDPAQELLAPLEAALEAAANTTCGRVRHVFLDPMRRRLLPTR